MDLMDFLLLVLGIHGLLFFWDYSDFRTWKKEQKQIVERR